MVQVLHAIYSEEAVEAHELHPPAEPSMQAGFSSSRLRPTSAASLPRDFAHRDLTTNIFLFRVAPGKRIRAPLDILDGLEQHQCAKRCIRFPEINGVCKPSIEQDGAAAMGGIHRQSSGRGRKLPHYACESGSLEALVK
jgi:hypothetical protein